MKTSLAALGCVLLLTSSGAWGGSFGSFSCVVDEYHGSNNATGKLWKNCLLLYNADEGTLQAAFHPTEKHSDDEHTDYFVTLNTRLQARTVHSVEAHIHAIQHDPVGHEGSVRPKVTWLMIGTGGTNTRFKYFSTQIEGILEGRCTKQ